MACALGRTLGSNQDINLQVQLNVYVDSTLQPIIEKLQTGGGPPRPSLTRASVARPSRARARSELSGGVDLGGERGHRRGRRSRARAEQPRSKPGSTVTLSNKVIPYQWHVT
jgi:hypothetical protein